MTDYGKRSPIGSTPLLSFFLSRHFFLSARLNFISATGKITTGSHDRDRAYDHPAATP
jgi:hypothetical protein